MTPQPHHACPPVRVVATSEVNRPRAEALALRLGLPLAWPGQAVADPSGLVLIVEERGMGLLDLAVARTPFLIDFLAPELAYRIKHGGGKKEMLSRAVGFRARSAPKVFDLTAGLGRDAFVLASLGATVTLFERSPVLAALLEDGLARAAQDDRTRPIVARMRLVTGDSLALVSSILAAERPDVLFLDPMYPHRSKSAAVKKEMRILRRLVGDDPDSGDLVVAALTSGVPRVVVKRPGSAPPLGQPSLQFQDGNHRFDVYLAPALPA